MTTAWSILLLLLCSTVHGQDYEGDTVCRSCHEDFPHTGFFEGYLNTGHPWQLFRSGGSQPVPGVWPFTPSPPLPTVNGFPLQWVDVEYVVGNYFWKAQFLDRDGYIWTGGFTDETQWNLSTQQFVANGSGEIKPYDCGKCHATGYIPEGNQNGLPGLTGTWAFDGVQCEACHGPSSGHAADPASASTPGGLDCASCHVRDPMMRMPWADGFMQSHQQAEALSHSPHAQFGCTMCHNPHRSTVFHDGGITVQCIDCHPGNPANGFYQVLGMEGLACIDCHMPFMAKSATTSNAYTADLRGHLFRIMTAPTSAADNVYTAGSGELYWDQNPSGDSWITLDYACLGCHLDAGPPLTLQDASDFAQLIHVRVPVSAPVPKVPRLHQNVPNPFNPSTEIQFSLPDSRLYVLTIYDSAGRVVKEFAGAGVAGDNTVMWHGRSQLGEEVASGVYLYQLQAGDFVETKRMVLLK